MNIRRINLFPVGLVATLGLASTIVNTKASFCQEKTQNHDGNSEFIAVFFKNESKVLMEKYLEKKGFKDHTADYVCIHSHPNKDSSYIFEPLYGGRTAFRLKGIVELADGRAVGVGRVSNMVGEVKDDGFVVSMPLFKKAVANHETQQNGNSRFLMDIPTRLSKIIDLASNPTTWKGRLPATTIGGQKYDAVSATYIPVTLTKQIVLDGHLCSNKYFNGERACIFDLKEEDLTQSSTTASSNATSSSKSENLEDSNAVQLVEEKASSTVETTTSVEPSSTSNDSEKKEAAECPVCRYMKGGPCKDEFLAWDTCLKDLEENQELTDCFPQTKFMMKCMQQYEYYDIMTAGTDFGRLEQIDEANAALANSSSNNDDALSGDTK